MSENAATNDAAKPDAGTDADRLAKLTKAELIEQVLSQREAADRLAGRVDELLAREAAPVNERSYADRMERELRLPRGGEGAVLITALLDLHRTVGAGSSGPTIRGRKGEQGNRYLEAARMIGDQLVNDLLGPSDR